MISYKIINFSDLPDNAHEAITEFKKDEILVDDSKLSKEELLKLEEWLSQTGYIKQVKV